MNIELIGISGLLVGVAASLFIRHWHTSRHMIELSYDNSIVCATIRTTSQVMCQINNAQHVLSHFKTKRNQHAEVHSAIQQIEALSEREHKFIHIGKSGVSVNQFTTGLTELPFCLKCNELTLSVKTEPPSLIGEALWF